MQSNYFKKQNKAQKWGQNIKTQYRAIYKYIWHYKTEEIGKWFRNNIVFIDNFKFLH